MVNDLEVGIVQLKKSTDGEDEVDDEVEVDDEEGIVDVRPIPSLIQRILIENEIFLFFAVLDVFILSYQFDMTHLVMSVIVTLR
ncbi:MAG: hypothetical protein DLD55_02150 [candidate division SR1 bacterium]|nr:MAG: hypothetical protein DLD55_02150 [candidate division SR1 bacterium]